MSYKLHKKMLEIRIEIMRKLKAGYPFNILPDTLEDALAFADTLKEEEALYFVEGINHALGSPENIANWTTNPKYIADASLTLQQFLAKSYPTTTTENEVRVSALAGLIVHGLGCLTILAFIAASTLFLTVMLPIMPIVSGILIMGAVITATVATIIVMEGISSSVQSFLGFTKKESLWDALFQGNRKATRVNNELSTTCGFFARQESQMVQYPPSDFPQLNAVYEPVSNSMYG